MIRGRMVISWRWSLLTHWRRGSCVSMAGSVSCMLVSLRSSGKLLSNFFPCSFAIFAVKRGVSQSAKSVVENWWGPPMVLLLRMMKSSGNACSPMSLYAHAAMHPTSSYLPKGTITP